MDIRNVQKTGNMYYVYLPTSWVKKFNISSHSKVAVSLDPKGSLIISSKLRESEEKQLHLKADSLTKDTLIKLIVACYLNPVSSFKIEVANKNLLKELLSDRGNIGALEFVNVENDEIVFESTLALKNPFSLFKTMLSKVKGIIQLLEEGQNRQLIDVYEREIDRCKLLIDKSMISALTFTESGTLKTIDLFYVSQASRDIERMVDNLVNSETLNKKFLQAVIVFIDEIKAIVEEYDTRQLEPKRAIALTEKALVIKELKRHPPTTYQQMRAGSYIRKVAETFLDWAVTNEISKEKPERQQQNKHTK